MIDEERVWFRRGGCAPTSCWVQAWGSLQFKRLEVWLGVGGPVVALAVRQCSLTEKSDGSRDGA